MDELEANRQSRKSAWATLQRLRKFLEAAGARIGIPEDRNFETEGEAIESGLKRTIAGRDAVMRSLIRAGRAGLRTAIPGGDDGCSALCQAAENRCDVSENDHTLLRNVVY